MKNRFLLVLALIALIPALLSACASPPRSKDELVGDWTQTVGTNLLTWQFKTDGTVHVITRTGMRRHIGVYRHLSGNRVALDFGDDLNSIVNLAILGNQLLITNPKGEVTTLLRANPDPKTAPKPQPTPPTTTIQTAPALTNQTALVAKPGPNPALPPAATPKSNPATNAPPKPGPNRGLGPL